ncbi:hypothetical protein F4781DRAFT_444825 [Annulohypoxylon bovei var. microspora]|nr:hypothetical protein F4781DRAFT_444825 [Annulohypoxylon bovei var. microspora]
MANSNDITDDPPPPYSSAAPTVVQLAQPQAQAQKQAPRTPGRFPAAFSMYRESGWGQRQYTLGEHQAAPLFAVALNAGRAGLRPGIVLHAGPSDAQPRLATVESLGWEGRRGGGGGATVCFPSAHADGQSGVGRGAAESFEAAGGLGHKTYTFSIRTGVGAAARREPFEWRHSSGDAVRALGGRGSGWKLCRLATEAPAGVAGGAFVLGGERAGDGKEVVAVWAWSSGSLTKTLKFQFLGSGANGVLGERWALMAVMTALKIWDIERRARQSSGYAGAGA